MLSGCGANSARFTPFIEPVCVMFCFVEVHQHYEINGNNDDNVER